MKDKKLKYESPAIEWVVVEFESGIAASSANVGVNNSTSEMDHQWNNVKENTERVEWVWE